MTTEGAILKRAAVVVTATLVALCCVVYFETGSGDTRPAILRAILRRIGSQECGDSWWIWHDGGRVEGAVDNYYGSARVTVFRCGSEMITLDGEVWPVAGVDRMEVWRNGEPMPMELDKVIVYGTDYIRDTSTYIQLSPKARSAVYALVHGNQRPATDTLQELCRAECSRIVRDSGRNASRALIRELVQGVLAAADGVDSSDRSDMDELAKGIDEGYRLEQESATSSGCAESILHIMDMHASVSTLYFGISDVAQDWKAEVFSLKVPRDCWVGLADYWDSIASTRLVEHWAGGYRFIELGRVVRDYACMMAGDRVNSAAEWRTYCQK